MILLILNIIKNLFNIMHKSILFLLICSLIMLLSFGSSISILSNSLAVEGMNQDMNNQDSSQIYEKFYKDDSFREAYYNYHKQHHQQEQQNQESRYNDNYDNNEKAYYNYNDNNNDKSKDNVIVKKINCNNINVNVNGLELDVFPSFLGEGLAAEAQEGSTDASSFAGNGDDSEINDFRFICINNNNNTVIGEVEEPVTPPGPPGPPEPITASLTAKKQVFGCADFDGVIMGCNLPNDSPAWLDCNTNPAISGTIFCQSLPESIFDIEVLDDQNNQIQQFEGSVQGTTIQNLESGTYTVNEIIHPTMDNQLGENLSVAGACEFSLGFSGGGQVLNTTTNVLYSICFEYEDEQGNNCSTITLAAGESRTCTVKNYIGTAFNGP